jgi:hypothetical protein
MLVPNVFAYTSKCRLPILKKFICTNNSCTNAGEFDSIHVGQQMSLIFKQIDYTKDIPSMNFYDVT